MASATYLPSYTPYSTVQSSMNSFMGGPQSPVTQDYSSSPLQYNMPLDQLRPQSSPTTLNGPISSQDRIQRLADRAYEKYAANQLVRGRIQSDFQNARADALGGMQGQNYNNYSPVFGGQGRGTGVSNPYSTFMSNQGAAGLLGGSTSGSSSRYNQWNNQIYNQTNSYNQAMAPVLAQFGVGRPVGTGRIATPW